MGRHRGVYDPSNPEPYELSRSKLEAFVRCPACFWLEKRAGVKFPRMPPFNINSNTDRLLKRDFDACRGVGPHPFMSHHGLNDLRPYAHPDLENWMSSLHFGSGDQYFSLVHACIMQCQRYWLGLACYSAFILTYVPMLEFLSG